jgi:hypothetical protein
MKVLALPADRYGCGHFRIIWSARALAAQGHDVTVVMPEDRNMPITVGPGEIVEDVEIDPSVDVVVLQRVTHPILAQAVGVLRRKGVAVVIDVDDDLSTVHPSNPAYTSMHPRNEKLPQRRDQRLHSWRYLAQACRDATLVVTSTPALLDVYASHGRGRVIENRLPEHYFGVEHEDSDVVGWPAALVSHPDDPSATGGALARIVNDGGRFVIAGEATGCGAAFGLMADPAGMGAVDLMDWPKAIARLGIGIAPLADTRFNRSKCVDSTMRICTDRGLIEAQDIRPGDKVWRDRWRAVEAVQHDVACPGFEVEMEGGYRLRLTPDHRMLVNGEWTRAADIRVGDQMAMTPEEFGVTAPASVPWPADSRMSTRGARPQDPFAYLTAEDSPRVSISPRWARFLGAFVGDGCAGQSTQITISCDGQDADWIDTLMDDFRAFGFNPLTQARTTFGGEVIRRRDVRVASAHLLRVLNSLGLTTDRENGRPLRIPCVPEVIWRSPREVVAAFLSGYFEADGNCTSSGVQLVSKSEDLIRDVQRLLVPFGIISRVSSRNHRAQNGFEGTYWHLTLGRAAADVFVKEIGFQSARKRERLEGITTRPHSNAYRPMNFAPLVTAVRPCMVRPVDIQVAGQEYMAAGFVSHNSWLKPLELAAVGVPCVMSPRAEYARLHAKGVGLLADRSRTWYQRLNFLRTNEKARLDLAAQGREAAAGLRLEPDAWRWWEAWSDALAIQRGAKAAAAA